MTARMTLASPTAEGCAAADAQRAPLSQVEAQSAYLPPLVRALLRPEAYPHPAGDLRLIETHISWVVLAGRYAYKLKKPVNFGFLDFSTLERRLADCQDEVRLNRRLCPDLYLGVVAVTRQDGQFVVGGRGELAEPAVWMRRLPQTGMLTHLLATGAADAPLLRRVARRLARFHASAATGPGVDAYGAPATLRANWEENFQQTAPFLGRTLAATDYHAIAGYVLRFLADQDELLRARVAAGRIREGHGDLHAESVCVAGRRLYLFDCLEFNPRFRCADVAAEVAFLAMDLDRYARPDLAEAFVQAYVRASGDRDLPRLLDFYRCYRAYVRGKVLSFRLDQPGLSPEQAEQVAAQARGYFELARRYAADSFRLSVARSAG